MKVKAGPVKWDPESHPSFWINHASRLLMRGFEAELRPLDFGMAYLPVVMALADGGALRQKELAEKSRVEQPTMAALLGRMERDGLISREPHPEDQRASLIRLTKKARDRIPEARERLFHVANRLTEGFSTQDRQSFLALLRRGVKNLDPDLVWPAAD